MIVGSLLLILAAVVMLGLGVILGENAFLVLSIIASLLTALVLIAGARRNAAARTAVAGGFDNVDSEIDGDRAVAMEETGLDADARANLDDRLVSDDRTVLDERPEPPIDLAREAARRRSDAGTVYGSRETDRRADTMVEDPADRASIPSQLRLDDDVTDEDLDLDDELDEDPPDEPAAQLLPLADADRVARMTAEVLVIDGRPRYHLAGCVHLLGREGEPLPVNEAVDLGFTPCSLCEPDTTLLAEARRA